MRIWVLLLLGFIASPALAAPGLLCGGSVAPGLAYPDVNGHWQGSEISLCRSLAAKLRQPMVFTPVLQDSDVPPAGKIPSVMFLPEGDIPAGYAPGPVIFNDAQAIMVPAGSPARHVADLANAEICVEPGSPEDFNLSAYFAARKIPLREFVFQETDEMHDAYVAGRCDAITARKSLLIGLRANEDGARQDDVILPDDLGDNPIRVATPAGLQGWGKFVDTTLSEANNVP